MTWSRGRQPPCTLILSVLVATISLACAARPKTVTLDVLAEHPVTIASVQMEPGASKLVNVGSYKVGKYKSKDLRALEKTLERSTPVRGSSETAFRAHVLLRSILIAHSNEKAAGIGCVAWALVSPEGELVFDEQFYVARDSPPLSIGGIKNRLHKAIAKRVHHRAQDVASDRPLSSPPEDTYDDFGRAASRVPNQLKSDIPTIFGGRDQWGYKTGLWKTVRGASGEESVIRYGGVDWYRRLGIPRPADAPDASPSDGIVPELLPPIGYPRTGRPGGP